MTPGTKVAQMAKVGVTFPEGIPGRENVELPAEGPASLALGLLRLTPSLLGRDTPLTASPIRL